MVSVHKHALDMLSHRGVLLSLRLFTVGILLLAVSGCSKNSFLGKRYDNFTAYYNTFYNAKKLYKSGVDALERASETEINRNQYLPIFITPGRVGSQQSFNDAILKSADVLRESPNSKWVDDALVLIGKSYYYLQNYVGSEQKFNEVISLGGSLEDEARFWLARNYIASGNLELAREHLDESLTREGLSSRWEPMFRLALAELFVRQEAWEEAVREIELGLDKVDSKTLAARAQFLLGQVYETLGQYESAIQSFARVPRYKPDYSIVYAANISRVRVETFHGSPEEALKLLRGMERDDKNFDSRAEMGYFRGRIYHAMGDAGRAFDTYDALLYNDDRTLNISTVRGRVHYALGELIRDDFVDYPYAAAHFDTASTALSSQNRPTSNRAEQVQFSPEAITDSDVQADVMGSYADVYNEIVRYDSLLWLADMDDETFDAFILELRKQQAKELAEQQRELARREAEKRFNNNTNLAQNRGPRKQIDGPEGNAPTSEQGFLFYQDRIRVQEGKQNFLLLWGTRPLVPNWRRLEAIENASSSEAEGEESVAAVAGLSEADFSEDFLPIVDFSDVPRDSARRVDMEEQRALVRYELANVLFLSMEEADSAAVWYRMVIADAGDQPVAQRAYYALAEVQRALGDAVSAERLYREVLDRYPNSDFADQVREQLGLPSVQRVETDSLALAEEAYQKAYQLWQQQNYQRAVKDMVMLAANYNMPEVEPRALLATGTIYLEWAARDQLNVHALPAPQVPDSVLFEEGMVDSTFFAEREPVEVLLNRAVTQLQQADSLNLLSTDLMRRSRFAVYHLRHFLRSIGFPSNNLGFLVYRFGTVRSEG